jgi:hypothetical protein
MNLFELVGVKRYRDHDLQQLIQAFSTESGYELISRGRMAYAFGAPGRNEVLKVWRKDTAYEHFVALAHEWHRNKHVPRFFTPVKELTIHGLKLKYVRMERLEEADSFKLDGKTYSIASLTEELTDSLSFDADKQLEDVDAYMKALKGAGPELRFYLQTATSLIYEMVEYGAQDDLKASNLLKRADGTPVITDPGAFGEELELAELDDLTATKQ